MPSSGDCTRVRVERGIYRQTNGKYAVCVMVGGRPRFRTLEAVTLRDARKQCELLRTLGAFDGLPLSPRVTFAEIAARWLGEFETKVASTRCCARTGPTSTPHGIAPCAPAPKSSTPLPTSSTASVVAASAIPSATSGCSPPGFKTSRRPNSPRASRRRTRPAFTSAGHLRDDGRADARAPALPRRPAAAGRRELGEQEGSHRFTGRPAHSCQRVYRPVTCQLQMC